MDKSRDNANDKNASEADKNITSVIGLGFQSMLV